MSDVDIHDIIKKIDKLILGLDESKWSSPDDLTTTALRLGGLKSTLGEEYVGARDDVRNQDAFLKNLYARRMRELTGDGTAVNRAKIQVDEEMHIEQMKLNELKKAEDLLKIKRDDVSEVIDVIRSRASFIKGETQ